MLHAKAAASATGLAKAKQQPPGPTAGRFHVVDRRRCSRCPDGALRQPRDAEIRAHAVATGSGRSHAIATAVANGQIVSWMRRKSVSNKRRRCFPTSSQRLLGCSVRLTDAPRGMRACGRRGAPEPALAASCGASGAASRMPSPSTRAGSRGGDLIASSGAPSSVCETLALGCVADRESCHHRLMRKVGPPLASRGPETIGEEGATLAMFVRR